VQGNAFWIEKWIEKKKKSAIMPLHVYQKQNPDTPHPIKKSLSLRMESKDLDCS
jgi:hypothetical protein